MTHRNIREMRNRIKDAGGKMVKQGSKHEIWEVNGIRINVPHGSGIAPWGQHALSAILRRAAEKNQGGKDGKR